MSLRCLALMNRHKFYRSLTSVSVALAFALCAVAYSSFAWASASDEIQRLAELMDWKPGTAVADIGAGDGRYAFSAVKLVGPDGKVFATEIDTEKLAALRSEVKSRHLQNV